MSSIDRQTAIEAVSNLASSMSVCSNIDESHGMKRMQEMAVIVLSRLPSAEPERKTGRWIHIRTEPDGNALYECSECHKGEVHVPIVEVHYCWNCGARMVGGEF